jgi:hypothetical protein
VNTPSFPANMGFCLLYNSLTRVYVAIRGEKLIAIEKLTG